METVQEEYLDIQSLCDYSETVSSVFEIGS